jgi:hypothetical protein
VLPAPARRGRLPRRDPARLRARSCRPARW